MSVPKRLRIVEYMENRDNYKGVFHSVPFGALSAHSVVTLRPIALRLSVFSPAPWGNDTPLWWVFPYCSHLVHQQARTQ